MSHPLQPLAPIPLAPPHPPTLTPPLLSASVQVSRTFFETPINYASVSHDGARMVCGGDSHCVYLCDSREDGSWVSTRSLREFSDAVMMCDWWSNKGIFAAVAQVKRIMNAI